MNIKNQYTRRKFLKLGSKVVLSLPLISVVGCDLDNTSLLNPHDSLKKMIFIIGPWSESEKQIADNFVQRFFKAKHTISPYLPQHKKIIQKLANRFSSDTMSIEDINLQELTSTEKELLLTLVKHIYNFVEVRFYVAKEPPWGQCQGKHWHTRIPDPNIS